MNKYSNAIRKILSELNPSISDTLWQYTDEEMSGLFEEWIRKTNESGDVVSRGKLHNSEAWKLREMGIILPIFLTVGVNAHVRDFVLVRYFTSLQQLTDLKRWFPMQEPFWDDDSLDIDEVSDTEV